MAEYLIKKNPAAKSCALEYAKLYLEEGDTVRVWGDGTWVQSCKETGNFKFSGGTTVTFDQNNFCDLGITGKGLNDLYKCQMGAYNKENAEILLRNVILKGFDLFLIYQ